MKHATLWAAAAVVIASNAAALIGVALNRSAVTQQIDLTERELTVDKLSDDNSGVSLHLRWVNSAADDGPGWLGADKLAELGFYVRTPVTDPSAGTMYRAVLPRDAFVVLELGGATWEAWVKKQEEREQQHIYNESRGPSWARSGTRLIAVDAGRDPAALRHRYPDQARYLIVQATIHLVLHSKWDRQTKRSTPDYLHGYIQQITSDEIHLPLPYASAISAAKSNKYVVTLCYGSRYEPWIAMFRAM
jgi:hypothetical protein